MAPTILVAGATGNTGRNTVETLSKLISSSDAFRGHRILALTRSASGAAAQRLAQLPGVEVLEKNWADVTADWLRENNVVRAFIAPHNQTNAFSEESTFLLAALHAGVEYVVRISTVAANVRPDCPAYYARAHWAIETLLGSPEFERMKWTSLQPNNFSTFYLSFAADFIKHFRETGKQQPLRLAAAEDAPVGAVHSDDVGALAAHLLVEKDVSKVKTRLVVNGPEDITGKQIVEMVEHYIGTKVEDVRYKDMSFVEQWFGNTTESKNVVFSVKNAMNVCWEGLASASTTSKEVLELAPPKTTAAEVLKLMVDGGN
ncbi:NAD(P)-binding protein [Podospora australis]|uniref:NAD(P)-binding protein n=1 Tax=Podospora australis TaxID=1536484 RepID=A0AAN7AJE0_9PEZI|nr:NAD(P)-binding protein [Podospora australis]